MPADIIKIGFRDITVETNGTSSYDAAGYVEITAPQEGDYTLDGLPPNTNVASVVVTEITPLTGAGGGEVFNMVNFDTQTFGPRTSATGTYRVKVGATARSTGNSNPYLDQTYTGTIEIQINF